MPQLNRILCSIQWRDSVTPFPEYGTVYGDGVVETYVVIPNKPQPFTIHVRSKGFIYEGLSVLVFVDGNYHANRNRVNLRPSDKEQALNRTEVDFLFRQKEKSIDGNLYMGREWRFVDHNIVSELPSGIKENHFDHLGTIEVIILRCRAKLPDEAAVSPSSSGADTDAFCERLEFDDADSFSNSGNLRDSAAKHHRAEDLVQTGLMSGLFDGADDRHYYTDPNQNPMPQGHSWAIRPSYPSNAPQSYANPSNYTYYQGWYPGTHSIPAVPKPEKRVHFDFGPNGPPLPLHGPREDPVGFRPPSHDRSRPATHVTNHANEPPVHTHQRSYAQPHQNYAQPVPQSYTAHRTSSVGSDRYRDDPVPAPHDQNQHTLFPPPMSGPAAYVQQAPTHVPMAMPVPIATNTCCQMYPASHDWIAPPMIPPHVHVPYGIQYPHHDLYGGRPSHKEPPNGNGNNTTFTSPEGFPTNLQPGESSAGLQQTQRNGNNQAQDCSTNSNSAWVNTADGNVNNGTDTPHWAQTDQSTTGPDTADINQQQNVASGEGWVGQNQDSGHVNDTNTGGDQKWCDNAPNGNINANDTDKWGTNDNDVTDFDTGNNDNTNWDNNANTSVGGWPTNNSTWQTNGQGASPDAVPATNNQSGIRPLYGPHGQYYSWTPQNPDAPRPDAEEEPRFDVPKSIADMKGITKQVQPGQGYLYVKKRCVPEYIDTMSDPYARFVFKYRTKEQLKKEIGMQVDMEPTGNEELQELQNLDKDALIEMLVRAKNALGGKVPSPPTDVTIPASMTSVEQTELVSVDPPVNSFLKYQIPPSRPTRSTGDIDASGTAGSNGNGNENDHNNTGTENRNEQNDNWGPGSNEQNQSGSSGNNDWNNIRDQSHSNNNIKWTDGSQEKNNFTAGNTGKNQLQTDSWTLQQPLPTGIPTLQSSTYMPSTQAQNSFSVQPPAAPSAVLNNQAGAQSAAAPWQGRNAQAYPSSLSSSPVTGIPPGIDFSAFGTQDGPRTAQSQAQPSFGGAPATAFGEAQDTTNPSFNW